MRWPEFMVVLAAALLALFLVPVAYVVWARIVGLDPTVAQWAAGRSRGFAVVAATLTGSTLGTGIWFAPSLQAGVASVVLLASSTFAGLLVFELYVERASG